MGLKSVDYSRCAVREQHRQCPHQWQQAAGGRQLIIDDLCDEPVIAGIRHVHLHGDGVL